MDDADRAARAVWYQPGRLLGALVIPIVITAITAAVVYRYVILEQFAPTASEASLVKLADLAGIAFLLVLAGVVPAVLTVVLLRRLSSTRGRIVLAALLGNVIAAVLGYVLGFGMLGVVNAAVIEGVLVVVGSLTFSISLLTRRARQAQRTGSSPASSSSAAS